MAIQKRLIEKTGENVSLLGFGCMRFPMRGGDTDIDKVKNMIDRAYASGVNYYDTAYVYGDGQSERAMGAALKKYPRESYFIADKLPVWLVNKPEDLDTLLNTSLERIGTNYIDYYLLHSLNTGNWANIKKYGVLDFCRRKQQEGKIRHIGFSFHDAPELFDEITDAFEWDFVQIQLNYLDWDIQRARDLYRTIERKGLSCVVMEPVRGGALARPPRGVTELFEQAAPGKTPASWALRYVASLPRVKVILSGMSDEAQVADNIATLSDFTPLSDAEREVLNKAVQIINSKPLIGCTGCRYCMPCPRGVDIPGCFSTYNDYTRFESFDSLTWQMQSLCGSEGPDACVACGACVKKCPQHLDIPDELKKVAEIRDRFKAGR